LKSRTARPHSRIPIVCCLLCACTAAAAPSPKDPRVAAISAFFEIMQRAGQPTIADFENLFGDCNENELDLQLLYEGWRSTKRVAPDAIVRRVNARLLNPTKHPSLYLCFLREKVPAARDPAWRLAGRPRRSRDGLLFYHVDTEAGPILFQFSDDEPVIEVVMESSGRPINSDVFHHLCRRGNCGAMSKASGRHAPATAATSTPTVVASPAPSPATERVRHSL
jgi:hypothetical protein